MLNHICTKTLKFKTSLARKVRHQRPNCKLGMQFECLKNVPEDLVSSLLVSDRTPHINVTAWDGTVSLYDYNANELVVRMKHTDPLLCSAWLEHGSKKYAGSVAGEVLEVDMESGKFHLVSDAAELGISAMRCSENDVLAGSWDGSLQALDTRSGKAWFTVRHENRKVLALDCAGNTVVVATTGGKVTIYDLRNMHNPKLQESGLKFQTRDIKLMPSGGGYVQSSLDGRVAVEYFGQDSSRFAFRCHRMNLSDTQFVFPVNALCFNRSDELLYTGGSDGRVFSWNLTTRKKSEELPKFEDSVLKLGCNDDVFCVATGDDSFKTLATIQDADVQPGKIYYTKL
ncbi:Bub3p [Lachancea thermotolerans CBS 6340]|uniref:KLTH0E02134p n=1 Tax=Lachancea thermotolerans (strain ATCC 56472 / CBS 6340 / NRRL Y-8284) TaxID=559295 RepID=C5DH84_LACTC|nr:KLTH0E02134p [Lachancea thermotolerans CBS 6340]CAR23145.1 KLTH0E02134p [Lachancea thermotolerans CBS 6340]